MRYNKIEKATARDNMETDELSKLATLYVRSDSISEFELKALTAGLNKFGFIKWFRLYYFLKDNSIYETFGWYVLVPGLALTSLFTWLSIDLLPIDILGMGWKALAILLVAGAGIAATVLTTRYMGEKLGAVKSMIWKKE